MIFLTKLTKFTKSYLCILDFRTEGGMLISEGCEKMWRWKDKYKLISGGGGGGGGGGGVVRRKVKSRYINGGESKV